MGQYRLSLNFNWQIGIGVRVDRQFITIALPFVSIDIGLLKHANGVY